LNNIRKYSEQNHRGKMRLTLFETFIGVGRIDPAGGGTALSSLIAALPSTL